MDLNLLTVFEALMHEHSVTRAASRLGLSQPAVSSALRRLREDLGDPLLLRTRAGMRPTARAEQILLSISSAFDSLQNGVQSGTSFSPEKETRRFTIMMSDIGEIVYLPRLLRTLQSEAPGIRLAISRLARPRVPEELATGSVDIAIGWMQRNEGLERSKLFDESFVGIVRPDHPRVRGRITKAQFVSEWHLVVGRGDPGSDTYLQPKRASDPEFRDAIGRRKIAIQVPHFLAVPGIVASTDFICVVPRRLGQVYSDYGQVRLVDLPFRSAVFTVSMFWHKRLDSDPANVWLRNVLQRLFSTSVD
jgi:DNA-binding transcriptional LysR family regulator